MAMRAELAPRAVALREAGWTAREIAAALDVSRSYATSLYLDPDGSKDAARKKRYGGTCERCGDRTSYGRGSRYSVPARLCATCAVETLPEPPHGTLARYQSKRFRCRCVECRAANRERMAKLKGLTPPRHGPSGYINYGCRCDVCRAAGSEKNRRNRKRRTGWAE